MSSSILRDLAAIRERAEQQERIERGRPSDPAEIVWQSGWYQGFGEEAREYIGLDNGKYYCAFMRSPAEDEEELFWDGPYDTREAAEKVLNERFNRWQNIRGEIEKTYEQRQMAEFERKDRLEQAFQNEVSKSARSAAQMAGNQIPMSLEQASRFFDIER